ncbi:hypothetical protein [Labrenzia sp. 011]|uniref:hypothetical protein n=1 Tax=Labrenzia sp. 011 TaxID=2171494 RepID=UPI000D5181AB|nr:hypothetical protein [Labrenzia sp. 011]PVB59343.1 hypothetical protein DCO57_22900 [Labrenzia sp. 011]
MPLNLDRPVFWVICELDGTLYLPETELADMSFHRIVGDIRSGQLENVQAVLESNPAEGWCNDITRTVMAAAFPETDDESGGEDWSDYSTERLDGRLAGVRVRVAA